MTGNGDRAGRNEWLGQETGHNSMRFAANAAAAYSPTLQRGVNKHPRRLGREYGRSRFTTSEF
jgi:hypothetical protein